jgi:hypothetical protein
MLAAVPAMPVKPRRAAINATTKNMRVQLNIVILPHHNLDGSLALKHSSMNCFTESLVSPVRF